MSGSEKELSRVPVNMEHKHNQIESLQSLLSGNMEFDDTMSYESNNFRKDDNTSTVSLEYSNIDKEYANSNLNYEDKDLESNTDLNISNNIEKQILKHVKQYVDKKIESFFSHQKNNFETSKDKTATLKIDVLSYNFEYTYLYQFTDVIVFVLKKEFSLNIKDPVKFKLLAEDDNVHDEIGVICIGPPMDLVELGIKLLIFAKD